jgi:protein PhnA
MSALPNCPKCQSEYTYEDGDMYICPECSHEWSKDTAETTDDTAIIKDSNGNLLQDGDTVTVIKVSKSKARRWSSKLVQKLKIFVCYLTLAMVTTSTAKLMVSAQ